MSKKSGFSLAELIAIMIVIGIIAMLSMQTMKSEGVRYDIMTFQMLRNLNLVAGQMNSKYPNSIVTNDEISNDNNFCNEFASNFKVVATNCGNSNYGMTISSPYEGLSSSNRASILLANGAKIYISALNSNYRVITFLMPTSRKNKRMGQEFQSFALYDNGDVLPLGKVADNTSLIKAKLNIYDSGENNAPRVVKNLTYRQARCRSGMTPNNPASYCNDVAVEGDCTTYACDFGIMKPKIWFMPSASKDDAYSAKNTPDGKLIYRY